jgi:hypothetical protein
MLDPGGNAAKRTVKRIVTGSFRGEGSLSTKVAIGYDADDCFK